MAKHWLRRSSKTLIISINSLFGLVFLLASLSPMINPASWWIHGFLPLMTPYLIIILLFFLLFWLISRPAWALISFLPLCIGYKQIPVAFAWSGDSIRTKFKANNSLRIVDWNVQNFNGISKNKKSALPIRVEVANCILTHHPDIICLQEFNTTASENNLALFTKTHPYYFFSADYNRGGNNYKSGSIIFSTYPIVATGKIDFPAAESLIYADILKGADTIRIYTTHLQSFKFKKQDYQNIERIKEQDNESLSASKGIIRKMKAAYQKRGVQADIVRSALDTCFYPSLICGDFNDVPNSYTYFKIRGNRRDAFLERGFGVGRTFISIAPTLRIDYILPDKSFEVKQFELVDEFLSDHIMLLSDLRLKK
jgi:endonuclease/exonuclease/phosphatase family metal-dependent hydrolase